MENIKRFKEVENRIRAIISENLNKILEYLESKEFKPFDDENSQVVFQQTQEQLPVLIICDTKKLQPHDYNILAELSQNTGVAIISSNSPTNKPIKNKPLTNILKAKKLLRKIVARLEWQMNYEHKSAVKIHKGLEVDADETLKVAITKSIFPFIPELNHIFDFIESHYHQQIGLHEVAQSVGYSAAYLTDLVRRKTGYSVHRWITKRRMVAACSLLLETDKSIDSIAEAVGYRNSWCFFRLFRKSFGMTPGVWRSETRNSVGKTYEI